MLQTARVMRAKWMPTSELILMHLVESLKVLHYYAGITSACRPYLFLMTKVSELIWCLVEMKKPLRLLMPLTQS